MYVTRSNSDTEMCPYHRRSLLEGLNGICKTLLLGKDKLSLLEGCPHCRGVLRECTCMNTAMCGYDVLLMDCMCTYKKILFEL